MAGAIAEGFSYEIEDLPLFLVGQNFKSAALKIQLDAQSARLFIDGAQRIQLRREIKFLDGPGLQFADHIPDLMDQSVDL